jgi:hypothetical protein
MNLKKTLRAIAIRIALVLVSLTVALIVLEVGFRLFYPQTMLTPRYDYLPDIGIVNFPNVKMRHRRPGVFSFTYSINAERYRGPLIPFDSPTTKIVVLGDSSSFGFGVQDDETFSAVLNRLFAGRYEVVNLGNGGWGLTHEIVRYLTFGAKYHPRIVILQFCENDPGDNMLTPLVRWDAQRQAFIRRPVQQKRINTFRRIVGFSKPLYTLLTGHSQTYNFFRDGFYRLVMKKDREGNAAEFLAVKTSEASRAEASKSATAAQARTNSAAAQTTTTVSAAEAYYNDLLEHFADSLHKSNIRLIMISLQGQLERFPAIRAKVAALNDAGWLTYLDTREWFDAGPAWASREGHNWGAKAHARVAEELANHILKRKDADWLAARQ